MRLTATSRRRTALSEAVGSLITIAITVIAGAGVFGFVNNQARVSELNYANSVGTTNNYLAENFKTIDMYFTTATAAGGTCTLSTYCTAGVWVYNLGNVNLQTFSVRLYDSASQFNILYNYTGSSTKTDRVYDLKASISLFFSTCRLAGSSYENPTISTVNTKIQNAQLLLLTIPPTTVGCPSYGTNFGSAGSGVTYYVVVTGLYGNSVTYYQVR